MKLNMKVLGLTKLNADLASRAKKSKKNDDGSVIVGHSMNYAIHVHERTDLQHKEGKQAKFLETAYKRAKPSIARIAVSTYESSKSLVMALIVVGLRIQRESMEITPVKTGALKASAYTAKESNAPAAAAAAEARGRRIQAAANKKRK